MPKTPPAETVEDVLTKMDAEPESPNPCPADVQPAPDEPSGVGTDALALLRKPAPPHHISLLSKETKNQREQRTANKNKGIRCDLCNGWHHRDALHVPYVGHAAVTDRLLEADPYWGWEPVAWTPEGLPRFDAGGGLWIRLTVCDMTRLGYGHAAQKPGQDPGAREKEVIGDALRNAAMRFGVALELWHKGELHVTDEGDDTPAPEQPAPSATEAAIAAAPEGTFITDEQRDRILGMATAAKVDAREICDAYGIDALPQLHADSFESVMKKLQRTIEARNKPSPAASDDLLDDKVTF